MTENQQSNQFKIKEPVGVLGIGVEGRATIDYLKREGVGQIEALDARPQEGIDSSVATVFGVEHDKNLQRFGTVFRSPSIRPDRESLVEAARMGTVITTAVSHFLEQSSAPVVGVTGTVGKGTSASIIAAMLEASGFVTHLGGNIGTSPLEFIHDLQPDHRVVLEISSFQAMDVAQSPQVAVILKTTTEHLDWHPNRNEYLQAKANLLAHQSPSDFVVYNCDVEGSIEIAQQSAARKVPFSMTDKLEEGLFVVDDRFHLIWEGAHQVLPIHLKNLALRGRFNWENVAASLLGAYLIGGNLAASCPAGEQFKSLPHRLELVGRAGEVEFVNDSYATRPDAAMAALSICEDTPLAVILGGSEKNADFDELVESVCQHTNIVHLSLIGQTAERLEKSLKKHKKIKFNITRYEGLEPAMEGAFNALSGRGTVLMAPGCASFGLFPNYKVRGERFRAKAWEIIEKQSKI